MAIRKIVQYRVKPDAVDAVRSGIADFVDAIAEHEPNTVYGSLALDDGASFVHCMVFPDEAAEETHRSAPHTRKFVDLLVPNCQEKPTFTQVTVARSTKKGGGFLGMGG